MRARGRGRGGDAVELRAVAALAARMIRETLRRNGFGVGPGERVSWLAKSSRDVALADLDGAPCDVLVSETLGVTVLDEQALGFMVRSTRARSGLLRARARACSRRCSACARRSCCARTSTNVAAVIRCDDLHELLHVDRAAGFDVRGVNSLRQGGGDGMRRSSRDFDISCCARCRTRDRRRPFEIFTIDFATDNATQFEGLRVVREGRARSAGAIHAVVAWFERTSTRRGRSRFRRVLRLRQPVRNGIHVGACGCSTCSRSTILGPSHVLDRDTIELRRRRSRRSTSSSTKVRITPATAVDPAMA